MLLAFLLYLTGIISYRLPIGTVVMAVAVLLLLVQRGSFRMPAPILLLLALTGWLVVGALSSPFGQFVWAGLIASWPKTLAVFLVALNALRTRGQLRITLICFSALFLLFPVRGALTNYFVKGYTSGGRLIWNGEFANPNGFGALALLQFSIAAGLFVTEPKRSRTWWLAVSCMLILPVVIILTQSRSVLIGSVIFGMLAFSASRQKALIATSVVIAVTVFAMLAPASVWKRFGGLKYATDTANIAQMDDEGSASERFYLAKLGIRLISDHPVLGLGLGAAPLAVHSVAPELRAKDLHNIYLTVAAESGLVGLALYVCVFAVTLHKCRRSRRRWKGDPKVAFQLRLLEYGVIGYLVQALWGSQPYLNLLLLQIALLWCIADVLERETRTLSARALEARN